MRINSQLSNYQNPAFGALKIKQPEGLRYLMQDSPKAIERLDDIQKDLSKCNYWDLIVDADGYKLAYAKTNKVYSVPVNPKKSIKGRLHPQLLIRTFNPEAKRSNLISFPVHYETEQQVRQAYYDIVHAMGIDKMLLIIKALEK
jgi:hypothetical protein